jgi:hypothetical protein
MASEPLADSAVDIVASSVRLATAADRHSWRSLGTADVACPPNTQLHQACNAVLHHLASPSSFVEGRSGLQLARLPEQGFLRVDLHRPSALTALLG